MTTDLVPLLPVFQMCLQVLATHSKLSCELFTLVLAEPYSQASTASIVDFSCYTRPNIATLEVTKLLLSNGSFQISAYSLRRSAVLFETTLYV
jgi:hypothetical protein